MSHREKNVFGLQLPAEKMNESNFDECSFVYRAIKKKISILPSHRDKRKRPFIRATETTYPTCVAFQFTVTLHYYRDDEHSSNSSIHP